MARLRRQTFLDSQVRSPVATTLMTKKSRTLVETPVAIVGAGPCGLFAAALLQSLCVAKVTVLERRPESEVDVPDISRSYAFGLAGRGMTAVAVLPDLASRLEGAVAAKDGYNIVMAMPDSTVKCINPRHFFGEGDGDYKPAKHFYRPRFVSCIRDHILSKQSARSTVRFVYDVHIDGIDYAHDDEGRITVRYNDGESLETAFLLGCDGINSVVVDSLQREDSRKDSAVQSTKGFGTSPMPTALSGQLVRSIRMERGCLAKVFDGQIPEDYVKSCWVMLKGVEYSGHSMPTLEADVAALGGYPMSLFLYPSHPLLGVRDPDTGYELLEENFPQLRGQLRDCVTVASMQEFLQGGHTAIPNIKTPASLGATVGASAGVVVLGDAAHAVTPELGHGLNAAMEDVADLFHVVKDLGKQLQD